MKFSETLSHMRAHFLVSQLPVLQTCITKLQTSAVYFPGAEWVSVIRQAYLIQCVADDWRYQRVFPTAGDSPAL